MFALLYVSRSVLAPEREQEEIAAIVRVSVARNAQAGVTGALLYTGHSFAQYLEGDELAVRAIMASIERDSRHTDVATLQQGPVQRRSLGSWSLAYNGRSTFAEKIVVRARTDGEGYELRKLTRLLHELVS